MVRARPRLLAALVLTLIVPASASFRAQSKPTHTLTFAELTYGNGITGLARDPSGGVWFVGSTCSTTLPTTSGAFQPTAPSSNCNGMFGKMDAQGAITYLSYIGGSRQSGATAIATDAAGNVYVAGYTYATDFPTTAGAYDRTCGTDGTCMMTKIIEAHPMTIGTRDGFVAKFPPTADHLIFSTYLGGQDDDFVSVMAVDSTGRVHVGGGTISGDFPVTSGAIQSSFSFGADPDDNYYNDAFYARLSADGSSLEYGTYLGGGGPESANALALDIDDNAFLAGSTGSPDFPTLNAAQPQSTDRVTSPLTGSDAFVARFSSTGPVYSTFLGGSSADGAGGVAVIDGGLYVTGNTCSADFPGGGSSASCHTFLSELSASNAAVMQTTMLEGTNGFDAGSAVAVDSRHFAYVGGSFTGFNSVSGSFPTTPDAYQRAYSAGWDAFFSIIDMSGSTAGSPPVVYSTLLGGGKDERVAAVILDGAGGAFFAGWSGVSNGAQPSGTAPFPSHTANAEPPSEGIRQSFAAHVGVAQATSGGSTTDVVLYARDAVTVAGNWQFVADQTAAAGTRIWEPDAGVPKLAGASASPANYFDLTFDAQAGVPYHLWLRMRADNDSFQNDSVFVQFSDSVDASSNPLWQIGTTSATVVSLEDCSGCGEQGWGWNDNGYGVAGTPVTFATSGAHTIRIQQREDGVSIDQIVLSSATWANTPPGSNKNDTTILSETAVTMNVPPTVTITRPFQGDTYPGPTANVTVTGIASDSDGSIAKVDIYVNGQLQETTNQASFSGTWDGLGAGQYTFVAIATDNQGASTTSSPVTITVSGGTSTHLPAGWTDADVGATGAAGSAAYSNDVNGVFTVQGAGADVWGTDDAFNFASTTALSGDGSVLARVLSASDEANWVKAGVMIRGSLDPASAQAFMLVSHAKGVCFQRRVSDGNSSESTCGSSSTAPRWVKLTRTGDVITGYESPDGTNWTMVGSDTFTMPANVDAGLAVSSHVAGTLATATFDHVLVYETRPGGGQCGNLTLSQTSFYSGGPASDWHFTMTPPNNTCTWTASIDQSWLLLNGAGGPATITGIGPQTVELQTLDNGTGALRYGTFTIGGVTYKVTQEPE